MLNEWGAVEQSKRKSALVWSSTRTCSHINEIFNPKQNQQEELMKLELVKALKKFNRAQLFTLRTLLVKAIDPLNAAGTDFHEEIMNCLKTAIGEKRDFFDRKKDV